MRHSISRKLLLATAVILMVAIAGGTYMLSKPDDANLKAPMKRVTFDLARPAEMKSYIKDWIPAYAGDEPERLGTIEGEPVLVIVKNGDETCSFESALIIVKIDPSQNDKLVSLYFSSVPMKLNQSVLVAKTILKMLRADDGKLTNWTKGAIAWTNNPKDWPENTRTPPDAWYNEAVRPKDNWYALQIRRSYSDTDPWRVTLDTGPSD